MVYGEAADGVKAIKQARNLTSDAVVIDVSMPKKDGLSVARIVTGRIFNTDLNC